jgi:hypothetical protein
MSDPLTAAPVSTIGRYRIVRLIARGGMGSLYLARDPAIDRTIAIKLLQEGFDDPAARERFAREARATGRLRHPNIVTVFDVGEHETRPFIAMEYVPGETLEYLIRRRAPLSIADRLSILEDVCAGLHFAHTEGIVHRDIKPANVILDVGGTVKILDFGLAHASDSGITKAGDQLGTLNYMSPEQVVGGHLDHRSDVYSVGVLAYELLSYEKAFPGTALDGTMYRILNEQPPPLERVVPGIDPEIPRIIDRAILKAPDQRYQDLEHLREEFATLRTRLADSEAGSTSDVRPSRARALAGVARDSSPFIEFVATPASSAATYVHGSAEKPAEPAAAASIGRRRFVLGGAGATALIVILSAVLYRSGDGDRLPSAADVDVKPAAPPAQGSAATPSPPTSAAAAGGAERRAIDERLVAIRATARRQITAGQRPQLLDTLNAGLVLDADDVELNGLMDELKRSARQLAAQARANAASRGATEASSLEFRDARTREREGDALDRSGDRAPAIRALWAATELYDRASRAAATAVAPPPVPAPVPQPPASDEKIAAPLPAAERPPPPTVPLAVEKPPPPAVPATPEPSAPAAADVARDARASDIAAIQEALGRYADAYRNRDINAVRKVLPSLTAQQLRELDKDFANYRSYQVDVVDPRISVDGDTAIVRCRVTRSFVTRNGVGGGHTVATTFHLQKTDAAWVIQRLESR